MDTVVFAKKTVQINGIQYDILLQDKEESPNALISLSNVLLLSPRLSRVSAPLQTLLNQSAYVSLNDLVRTLAAIGSRSLNGPNGPTGTDYNQLQQILLQMYSGLDINPGFNGSFEDSTEISIFRLFNVGIVHGWIIDAENDPVAYDHVSKYTYHGAQRVLVQSYDIKKSTGGANGQPLQLFENQTADQILSDSNYIKAFLARSATQLTDSGLAHLRELQVEKSFCVLFRNDHFYTLFKNDGELYTLVDDPAFKDDTDVVWKSLKSVSGTQDSYYTGNFILVSQGNSQRTANNGGAKRDIFRDSAITQQTVESSMGTGGGAIPNVNPFSDPQTTGPRSPVDSQGQTRNWPRQGDEMGGSPGQQKQSVAADREQQQQMQEDEELARRLQAEEDEAAARMFNRNYGARGRSDRVQGNRRGNRNGNNMAFGVSDSDDEDDEYGTGAGASSGFGKKKTKKGKFKGKDKLKKKKCIIM